MTALDVLLPVHCCCTPGLRLGFVTVASSALERRSVSFMVPRPMRVTWGPSMTNEPVADVFHAPIRKIWLVLAKIELIPVAPGIYETSTPLTIERLAVESADQPIEVWRKVRGFVEAQKVYR